MIEDDLLELAAVISRAWAGGFGRPEQDADVVRPTVLDALREIRDRDGGATEDGPPSVAMAEPRRSVPVKLIYCPSCESILRDVSALQRHRRFCSGREWRAGGPRRDSEASV